MISFMIVFIRKNSEKMTWLVRSL